MAFPIGATLCSDSLLRMQESYVCGVYAAADAHNFKVHLRLKWAKLRRSVSSLLSDPRSRDSEFNASRKPSERRVLGPLDSSLAESDPKARLKHYCITGHVEAHREASA